LIPGQLTAEGQVLFDGEVLVLARRPKLRACATSAPSTPELRLLAAVRWSIREHGGEPSSRLVDELLDERVEISASSVR
jgi:hypothetical protein